MTRARWFPDYDGTNEVLFANDEIAVVHNNGRPDVGFDLTNIDRILGMRHFPMSGYADWYCGYCRFDRDPLGGSTFGFRIPAPGGITFRETAPEGSYVYGFDTMHGVENANWRDPAWLIDATRQMRAAILAAAPFAARFQQAVGNQERHAVMTDYHMMLAIPPEMAELDPATRAELTEIIGRIVGSLGFDQDEEEK